MHEQSRSYALTFPRRESDIWVHWCYSDLVKFTNAPMPSWQLAQATAKSELDAKPFLNWVESICVGQGGWVYLVRWEMRKGRIYWTKRWIFGRATVRASGDHWRILQ